MLRKTPKYERIAFVASPAPEAKKALARLVKRYGNVTPSKGRRRGRARRRRPDAAHLAPGHEGPAGRSTACTAAPSAS
jgi:hypothetical protein